MTLAGAVDEASVAGALAELALVAGVGHVTGHGTPASVRDVLRADFLCSPRAAPGAVAAIARTLAA